MGNLVLHLAGSNRFYLKHVIGGAPSVRDRDAEFAARGHQAKAVELGGLGFTLPRSAPACRRSEDTTIFDEATYQSGFWAAMIRLMDDWGLRFPGIRTVEHVFFYAVHGASNETRRAYLERAYSLGRNFSRQVQRLPGSACSLNVSP